MSEEGKAPCEDAEAAHLVQLNAKKLRLEITALRQWKRRAVMQPTTIIAIVAASGSLLLAYVTGVFNVQEKAAALKLEETTFQLAQLQVGKTKLNEQIVALQGTVANLNAQRTKLSVEVQAARRDSARLTAERDGLERETRALRANLQATRERVSTLTGQLASVANGIRIDSINDDGNIRASQVNRIRNELQSIVNSIMTTSKQQ